MEALRSRVVVLVVLAAAALTWTLIGSVRAQGKPPAPGSAPVTVVNTPLPTGRLGVSGTVDVQVTNVPAVNAAQNGTWTVGITGTPLST